MYKDIGAQGASPIIPEEGRMVLEDSNLMPIRINSVNTSDAERQMSSMIMDSTLLCNILIEARVSTRVDFQWTTRGV